MRPFLCILAAFFILTACQKTPSVEGTWTGRNGQLEVEMRLLAGGAFEMDIVGPNREAGLMLNVMQRGTYAYSPSEKTITVKLTEVKVSGVQKGMEKTMEDGIMKAANQTGPSKAEMPDKDTLILTASQGSTTFKRKP